MHKDDLVQASPILHRNSNTSSSSSSAITLQTQQPQQPGPSAAEPTSESTYSVKNEISFFFSKGLPLGLSALFEWGLPPWLAMIFAGHTEESAKLQSALGLLLYRKTERENQNELV